MCTVQRVGSPVSPRTAAGTSPPSCGEQQSPHCGESKNPRKTCFPEGKNSLTLKLAGSSSCTCWSNKRYYTSLQALLCYCVGWVLGRKKIKLSFWYYKLPHTCLALLSDRRHPQYWITGVTSTLAQPPCPMQPVSSSPEVTAAAILCAQSHIEEWTCNTHLQGCWLLLTAPGALLSLGRSKFTHTGPGSPEYWRKAAQPPQAWHQLEPHACSLPQPVQPQLVPASSTALWGAGDEPTVPWSLTHHSTAPGKRSADTHFSWRSRRQLQRVGWQDSHRHTTPPATYRWIFPSLKAILAPTAKMQKVKTREGRGDVHLAVVFTFPQYPDQWSGYFISLFWLTASSVH